jgi:hypothetical protein
MAEVDTLLLVAPALRPRVREVHPEVRFWALNGHASLQHPKSKPEGRNERIALLSRYEPETRTSRAGPPGAPSSRGPGRRRARRPGGIRHGLSGNVDGQPSERLLDTLVRRRAVADGDALHGVAEVGHWHRPKGGNPGEGGVGSQRRHLRPTWCLLGLVQRISGVATCLEAMCNPASLMTRRDDAPEALPWPAWAGRIAVAHRRWTLLAHRRVHAVPRRGRRPVPG